jgi:hypothetical protein
MAFTGLSTNRLFTPNLIGEDISKIIATLAPVEAPVLDWLGDGGDVRAADQARVRHGLPAAALHHRLDGGGVGDRGDRVPGQRPRPGADRRHAARERIGGARDHAGLLDHRRELDRVTRNYDGAGIGSLAAGGQFYVRGPAGIEGQEHSGEHTARPGSRQANTVGLFNIPIAVSGTQAAIARNTLGNETFDEAKAKLFRQVPSDLEKEVLRGVLNTTNSLGTSTATRTMKGVRSWLTGRQLDHHRLSFTANPHKYIGNVWQQAFNNGASADETGRSSPATAGTATSRT